MYVSDASNNVIYKISPQGVTSLFAGSYGTNAVVDGYGSAASFTSIREMCFDSYSGWIMIGTNLCLRAANPATGQVITLCGTSVSGNANNQTGTSATFNIVTGICSAGSGNLYICDGGNHNVCKVSFTLPITANGGTKVIIAGSTATPSGVSGYYNNATGTSATFSSPRSLVINSSKTTLWVGDLDNNVVRQVSLTAPYAVTTFAGAIGSSATPGNTTAPAGASVDSTTAGSVRFNGPYGLAIDASNNIFVTEYYGRYLRFINTTSFYTHTLSGNGTAVNTSGVGTNGAIAGPTAVTVDSTGNPWIVNSPFVVPAIFNYNIQTGYLNLFYQASNTTPTPNSLQNTPISTIIVPAMATTTLYGAGFTAFNSGVTYVSPQGLLMDSQNNLYVSDKFKMRKVAPSGFVTSIFGDPSNIQNADEPFPGAKGQYNGSFQMCFDNSGNMYIADPGTSTIHVVNVATGAVTNLAPTGQALNNCLGILFNNGTLYVSNTNILASPPAGYIVSINLSTNASTLIAGSTTLGALTNANGTAARFNYIYGMCFDVAKQNILICDRGNTAIRNYNISTTAVTTYSTGVVLPSFIAADSLGNYYATSGTALYKIVAGTATSFSSGFSYVLGITLDAFNNIYVSDVVNNCIYFINPAGTSSVYSGIAGSSGTQDSLYASTVSIVAPYVGINKSNAQYTLDVGGSVNFTAGLYSNGVLFSGGTSSFSTLNAYTINFTSSITSNGLPFTSGVSATSGFAQVTNLPLSGDCRGICFDSSGNMYVANNGFGVIYKITPQGVTSLLAGTPGVSGWADGTGSSALLNTNGGQICYDPYTNCIALADATAVRLITLTGTVITMAGNASSGNATTPVSGALFNRLTGVCSDGSGSLYIVDANNNNIKKVALNSSTPTQYGCTVTNVAGPTSGTTSGYTNDTGVAARFNTPFHIAINPAKTFLYVPEFVNSVIRSISLPGYVVTTLAGALTSPIAGTTDSTTATSVQFGNPIGVATDASGNVLIVEYGNNDIRYINVSPFYTLTLAGKPANTGSASGVGTNAQVYQPVGITLDSYGNPWIMTTTSIFNYNLQTGYANLFYTRTNTVPRPNSLQNTPISTIIVPAVATTTLFGSDFTSLNSVVTYLSPQGILMDSQNNLFVSDKFKIRKVSPSGFVTSVFGDPSNTQDTNQPFPGAKGQFNGSYQMCFDNSGNLYIADSGVSTVHVVNVATGAVTNLAPTGQAIGNCYGVLFNAGILYVSNTNMTASPPAGYIVAVNLATNVGTLIAGSTTLGALTNANGTSARFNFIYGMCFDVAKANIFICDRGNSVIRQYNISSTAVTTYSSVAASCIAADSLGNYYATGGTSLFKIVGGTATSFSSGFSFVLGVTVDSFNNIYVSDIINNCIYMINSGGIATVYSGTAGITGTQDSVYGSTISLLTPYVGINKSNAQYNLDVGGSINFSGGLYSNGSLFFGATTPNMTLSTLSTLGQATFNSNVQIGGSLSVFSSISAYNMNATGMNVNTLTANTGFAQVRSLPAQYLSVIAFDPSNNMYVGDGVNGVIYEITPQGQTSLLAGSGIAGYSDGIGSAASFTNLYGMIYDPWTNGLIVGSDAAVRWVSLTGQVITIAGSTTNGNVPNSATPVAGSAARFNGVYGLCGDGSGNYYIPDRANYNIKKITLSSRIVTPSTSSSISTCSVSFVAGSYSGLAGYVNATGPSAFLNDPRGITINPAKTHLFFADRVNNVIRAVNIATTAVTTVAGSGTGGTTGANLPAGAAAETDSTTAANVQFNGPVAVCCDSSGNLLVTTFMPSPTGGNTLRYININYTSAPIANYTLTLAGLNGSTGAVAGVGTNSRMFYPICIAFDIYQTPWIVAQVTPAIFNYNLQTGYLNLFYEGRTTIVPTPGNIQNTAISTITAPAIATGTIFGSGFTITNSNSLNPGGATYTAPNGLLIDSQNNVYVGDQFKIRKISPSGFVTSIYGDPTNTQSTIQVGRGATGVLFTMFQCMCLDNSGNMYASQYGNSVIYRINLATGVASLLTITGQALNGPNSILFNNNILYVINENFGGSGFTTGASYVVAINLATNVSVLVAGSPTSTSIFNTAFSMCFDVTKTNIYVSNFNAPNIKIIANYANTGSYPITPTIFTTSGLAGVGPVYITSDNLGNFYITGFYTGIPVPRGIIKITSAGVASSFANTVPYNGATINLATPQGIAVDSYNNVYFADVTRDFVGIITPGGTASVYSGVPNTSGTQDSTYASSIALMAPFVGINTVNPTAALHVSGSAPGGIFTTLFTVSQGDATTSYGTQMSLYTPNGGTWAINSLENGVLQYRMWFSLSNGGVGSATIYNAPSNTHPSPTRSLSHIFRYNNSVELMTLDNAGNAIIQGDLSVQRGFYGKLSSNAWISSTDDKPRLFYSNNSHSIYRTADHHIFRNSADTTILTITGAGAGTFTGTLVASGGFYGNFGNNQWITSVDTVPRLYFATNGDTFIYTAANSTFYFQSPAGNVANINGNTGTYTVMSDQRIKKNIVITRDSLDIINQINIVSYDYIDSGRGSVKHGIVAQQLKQVYPDAVDTLRNVIPSHLTVVDFDLDASENIIIKCSTPHELLVNDTVKLDIDNKRLDKVILEVPSDTTFIVSSWDNFSATSSVSLYGKYVNDFLSYDKSQIGILAAGACQTLSGQVSTLQAENLELRSTVQEVVELRSTVQEVVELRSTIAAILEKYPV
jgi:hypothetical protein